MALKLLPFNTTGVICPANWIKCYKGTFHCGICSMIPALCHTCMIWISNDPHLSTLNLIENINFWEEFVTEKKYRVSWNRSNFVPSLGFNHVHRRLAVVGNKMEVATWYRFLVQISSAYIANSLKFSSRLCSREFQMSWTFQDLFESTDVCCTSVVHPSMILPVTSTCSPILHIP